MKVKGELHHIKIEHKKDFIPYPDEWDTNNMRVVEKPNIETVTIKANK